MSIVTLKRKTQAQYKTQNNMGLEKKLTDCGENCAKSITGYVTTTGDQTITSGVKSFVVLPRSSAVPSRADELVNKLYVDNSISSVSGGSASSVTLTGNQTITGLKTFGVLPQSSVAPSNVNDLVNRGYADNLVGLSFNLDLNGNYDISNNISYKNSTVRIASNGAYNLTVPLPTLSALANSVVVFQNDSSYKITLVSSAFQGKYGSNNTTLILPANTWVKLFSNGTNWLVNDRSAENQIYYPTTFTNATDTIATNFQYINSELHLTSTFAGSFTLTLPAVSVAQTINQQYIIYNDNSLLSTPNSNPIVLTSTGTSYFRGIYQNNATGATQLTYTLAPNSKVEFYNNGTNWIITSIGDVGNQLTPILTTADPTIFTRPLRKNYIISNNVGGANQGFTLPAPLPSDVGVEIFFRKGWNYANNSSAIYLNNNLTTAPPSTTNPVYTLSSSIVQPTTTNGTNFGAVLGVKLTVFQYGYKGTGTIAFVSGSTTCTVSAISVGAVITHYQPIVLTSAPVASVQVNDRPASGGGIGGNGTYTLTTAWSNPDASYSFTISDFYAWTQI